MEKYFDYFISYTHLDSEIATEIKNELEERGFSCFMAEKDILVSSIWEEDLQKALKNSKKIIIVITPRSKDKPWILLEVGAGWILDKPIIPLLMFIKPNDLVEPIKKYQFREIETTHQRTLLIKELTANLPVNFVDLSGTWKDLSKSNSIYFHQEGNEILGIYDYDGRNSKVGFYKGKLTGNVFNFEWSWFNNRFRGFGQLVFIKEKNVLSGSVWYSEKEYKQFVVSFEFINRQKPSWIVDEDFNNLRKGMF